MVSWKTVVKLE